MTGVGLLPDNAVSVGRSRRDGDLQRGAMAPPDRRGHAVKSEFDLLGDAERVVDLDPEIANGAFQLGVTEQKLHRPQIAGLAIDLGCFVRLIEWVR